MSSRPPSGLSRTNLISPIPVGGSPSPWVATSASIVTSVSVASRAPAATASPSSSSSAAPSIIAAANVRYQALDALYRSIAALSTTSELAYAVIPPDELSRLEVCIKKETDVARRAQKAERARTLDALAQQEVAARAEAIRMGNTAEARWLQEQRAQADAEAAAAREARGDFDDMASVIAQRRVAAAALAAAVIPKSAVARAAVSAAAGTPSPAPDASASTSAHGNTPAARQKATSGTCKRPVSATPDAYSFDRHSSHDASVKVETSVSYTRAPGSRGIHQALEHLPPSWKQQQKAEKLKQKQLRRVEAKQVRAAAAAALPHRLPVVASGRLERIDTPLCTELAAANASLERVSAARAEYVAAVAAFAENRVTRWVLRTFPAPLSSPGPTSPIESSGFTQRDKAEVAASPGSSAFGPSLRFRLASRGLGIGGDGGGSGGGDTRAAITQGFYASLMAACRRSEGAPTSRAGPSDPDTWEDADAELVELSLSPRKAPHTTHARHHPSAKVPAAAASSGTLTTARDDLAEFCKALERVVAALCSVIDAVAHVRDYVLTVPFFPACGAALAAPVDSALTSPSGSVPPSPLRGARRMRLQPATPYALTAISDLIPGLALHPLTLHVGAAMRRAFASWWSAQGAIAQGPWYEACAARGAPLGRSFLFAATRHRNFVETEAAYLKAALVRSVRVALGSSQGAVNAAPSVDGTQRHAPSEMVSTSAKSPTLRNTPPPPLFRPASRAGHTAGRPQTPLSHPTPATPLSWEAGLRRRGQSASFSHANSSVVRAHHPQRPHSAQPDTQTPPLRPWLLRGLESAPAFAHAHAHSAFADAVRTRSPQSRTARHHHERCIEVLQHSLQRVLVGYMGTKAPSDSYIGPSPLLPNESHNAGSSAFAIADGTPKALGDDGAMRHTAAPTEVMIAVKPRLLPPNTISEETADEWADEVRASRARALAVIAWTARLAHLASALKRWRACSYLRSRRRLLAERLGAVAAVGIVARYFGTWLEYAPMHAAVRRHRRVTAAARRQAACVFARRALRTALDADDDADAPANTAPIQIPPQGAVGLTKATSATTAARGPAEQQKASTTPVPAPGSPAAYAMRPKSASALKTRPVVGRADTAAQTPPTLPNGWAAARVAGHHQERELPSPQMSLGSEAPEDCEDDPSPAVVRIDTPDTAERSERRTNGVTTTVQTQRVLQVSA